MVNPGLQRFVQCKKRYKINVVNIGVKMFERNRDDRSEAKFRLVQEGL